MEDGEEKDKALVRVVCIWKSGKNSRKVSKMVITVEKGHNGHIMTYDSQLTARCTQCKSTRPEKVPIRLFSTVLGVVGSRKCEKSWIEGQN